jgi:hypothetical protein
MPSASSGRATAYAPALSGHQRSSAVIRGHQRTSEVIRATVYATALSGTQRQIRDISSGTFQGHFRDNQRQFGRRSQGRFRAIGGNEPQSRSVQ